jgi:hypothetical protein
MKSALENVTFFTPAEREGSGDTLSPAQACG